MAAASARLNRRTIGLGLGLGALCLLSAPTLAQQAATSIPQLTASSLPVPPPIGLPVLQSQVSCPALQQRLAAVLGPEAGVWSVSVADGSGRLLADINGSRPRIPASNQKLISTAIALDRLGPDYSLTTRLMRQPDGSLRLSGQGDPDLDLPQLQRFARIALGAAAGAEPAGTAVRIQLAEEPQQRWWPAGWNWADRAEAYGAPITRLALTSNALDMAVSNPPSRLQRLLSQEIRRQGGSANISLVPAGSDEGVLLHEERSVGMHGLLSLANTESHNFTAEVLLRQGTGSWDLQEARRQAMQWLAALLLRMAHHPYAANYAASMAIAGQRGTLRNLFRGTDLEGEFRGKTGTISGVRSISGILNSADGPRYISMVSNGASTPNSTIGGLLRQSRVPGLCPAF